MLPISRRPGIPWRPGAVSEPDSRTAFRNPSAKRGEVSRPRSTRLSSPSPVERWFLAGDGRELGSARRCTPCADDLQVLPCKREMTSSRSRVSSTKKRFRTGSHESFFAEESSPVRTFVCGSSAAGGRRSRRGSPSRSARGQAFPAASLGALRLDRVASGLAPLSLGKKLRFA